MRIEILIFYNIVKALEPKDESDESDVDDDDSSDDVRN